MRACFLSLLCLPLLLVIRSGVFGPESRFTLGTRLIMMSDVCIHMHDCVFDGVELHSLMQRSRHSLLGRSSAILVQPVILVFLN